MALLLAPDAQVAYDELAADYDTFTVDYAHEHWLAQIDDLVRALGLRGRTVLDVACGTGKSFVPLLERGYDVTGCDVSPEMLAVAAAKPAGERVELVRADMRDLPALGPFDLVTCLNDAVNYLTGPDDLVAFLDGARRVLRPGGLLVFDVNTLVTYRSAFTATAVLERDGRLFEWTGLSDPDRIEPGGEHVAILDVFSGESRGTGTRRRSVHVQRHHPASEVGEALATAGLERCATYGQLPGAQLVRAPLEERHPKLLFVAQTPDRGGPR